MNYIYLIIPIIVYTVLNLIQVIADLIQNPKRWNGELVLDSNGGLIRYTASVKKHLFGEIFGSFNREYIRYWSFYLTAYALGLLVLICLKRLTPSGALGMALISYVMPMQLHVMGFIK